MRLGLSRIVFLSVLLLMTEGFWRFMGGPPRARSGKSVPFSVCLWPTSHSEYASRKVGNARDPPHLERSDLRSARFYWKLSFGVNLRLSRTTARTSIF